MNRKHSNRQSLVWNVSFSQSSLARSADSEEHNHVLSNLKYDAVDTPPACLKCGLPKLTAQNACFCSFGKPFG
jgi:hypothetical protein